MEQPTNHLCRDVFPSLAMSKSVFVPGFSALLGEMIHFDYYFSDGLKPPISLSFSSSKLLCCNLAIASMSSIPKKRCVFQKRDEYNLLCSCMYLDFV